MNDYHFQVDLKGIIRLLSDNLYTSDQVFLRELLQNAVDAIAARQVLEPDFQDGEIKVQYQDEADGAMLTFWDNGVGLTEQELHTFLSVIGQSSKRGEEVRHNFIGQFGIGLLSCFLVTNQITVITQSVQDNHAYQWLGRSDGTYEVTEAPAQEASGSKVCLKLKGAMAQKFHAQQIQQALYEFGFLLKTPIRFEQPKESRVINANFIPWRHDMCTKGQIMEFGELLFGQYFFDVVQLDGDGLHGYAYISAQRTSGNAQQTHKVYLKDMFITEDGRDLIPKWAFFTHCVIDAEDLTPTAAREGFQRDNKLLKARSQIEQSILDYFIGLSQYDTPRLKALISIHNVAIKSLAVENDRIYQLFFPFLVFSTSRGELTGAQLLHAAEKMPVYYCDEVDSFRRVRPLLEHSKRLLINAGYIYDTALLQRLRKFYKQASIQPYNDTVLENLFDEPSAQEAEQFTALLAATEAALNSFHCRAVLRCFTPENLATLFIPGQDIFLESSQLSEDSFPSFLDGFSDYEEINTSVLYLNAENTLICALASVNDPNVLNAAIQILYVQALLTGHHPAGPLELEALNQGLTELLQFGIC